MQLIFCIFLLIYHKLFYVIIWLSKPLFQVDAWYSGMYLSVPYCWRAGCFLCFHFMNDIVMKYFCLGGF